MIVQKYIGYPCPNLIKLTTKYLKKPVLLLAPSMVFIIFQMVNYSKDNVINYFDYQILFNLIFQLLMPFNVFLPTLII